MKEDCGKCYFIWVGLMRWDGGVISYFLVEGSTDV